jgi:hypothetical protein
MFNADKVQDKWAPILEHNELPAIQDNYRKSVTAVLLENQEKALREERSQAGFLAETPANATGAGVDTWDPVLISLVRRSMPNLIAYDIAGVQPMSGPTGLIFAMKSRYTSQSGAEALFNEADTDFSGAGTHGGSPSSVGGTDVSGTTDGSGNAAGDDIDDAFGVGTGMDTTTGESRGNTGTALAQMAFSIDKTSVTAKTRALKAEYTMELAQDLKAIHGLDAEAELANILSAEILAEINREVIRTINVKAKRGAQTDNVTTAGTFSVDTDTDGRWSVEKFKGLLVQIEREANVIAKETRRGKGNFIICSSDVAAALAAAGMLDYAPALATNLNVDDTGNTFAGVINGRMKVYVDPYASVDYVTVGYRGSNPYDAGMFYAPYVPLTMVRAVGENDFQPRIGFKTRYGMVANPFAGGAASAETGTDRANQYFRVFKVTDILASA